MGQHSESGTSSTTGTSSSSATSGESNLSDSSTSSDSRDRPAPRRGPSPRHVSPPSHKDVREKHRQASPSSKRREKSDHSPYNSRHRSTRNTSSRRRSLSPPRRSHRSRSASECPQSPRTQKLSSPVGEKRHRSPRNRNSQSPNRKRYSARSTREDRHVSKDDDLHGNDKNKKRSDSRPSAERHSGRHGRSKDYEHNDDRHKSSQPLPPPPPPPQPVKSSRDLPPPPPPPPLHPPAHGHPPLAPPVQGPPPSGPAGNAPAGGPDFTYTGKLADETNKVNGVVLKYQEPPEAAKPTLRWRLYTFKNGELLGEPLYIHRQSWFLFGKDRRIADIPTDHPSISKQHAVLQYREVESGKGKEIKPYLMDLGSVNGTFLNGDKLESSRYYELLEQDMFKFGSSTREYVLLHDKSAG